MTPLVAAFLFKLLGAAGGFGFAGGFNTLARTMDTDSSNDPNQMDWALPLMAMALGLSLGPSGGMVAGPTAGLANAALNPTPSAGAVATQGAATASPSGSVNRAKAPAATNGSGNSQVASPTVRGASGVMPNLIPTRPDSLLSGIGNTVGQAVGGLNVQNLANAAPNEASVLAPRINPGALGGTYIAPGQSAAWSGGQMVAAPASIPTSIMGPSVQIPNNLLNLQRLFSGR